MLAVLRAAAGHGAVVASRLPVVGVVRHGSGNGNVAGVVARCAETDREVRIAAPSSSTRRARGSRASHASRRTRRGRDCTCRRASTSSFPASDSRSTTS
ncbi:MAG: hypothetical protein R2695_15045 [Acidimicrobiales bacterium]